MRSKQCRSCGAIYETEKIGSYLCPACALQSRRDSVCRDRVCVDCGVTFTGYPRSLRCPACRDAHAAELARARGGKTARPIGSIDYCTVCGRPYAVTSGRQKYCPDCKTAATMEAVRDHKRRYQADYSADPEHKAAKDANGAGDKVCVICGALVPRGSPTVTCSPDCAAMLRKLRQREADVRRAEKASEYRKSRWAALTREQKDEINRKARERYARRKEDK